MKWGEEVKVSDGSGGGGVIMKQFLLTQGEHA